jgi:hypothetical protein
MDSGIAGHTFSWMCQWNLIWLLTATPDSPEHCRLSSAFKPHSPRVTFGSPV